MKHISFLFLLIGFVLLSLTGKTKAQISVYDYISPRPGAKYVSSETTIVFRSDDIDDGTALAFTQVKIIGQESGEHPFTVRLAADGKTAILDPVAGFLPGETVFVTDKTKALSFAFTVSTKTEEMKIETAVSPWSDEAAVFDLPDLVIANRPYQTLSDDFPAIAVTVPANGTSEDYLFASNFTWGDFGNSHPHLMILDNEGEPVFVRKMADGQMVLDFKVQPNGLLTYYEVNLGYFVALDNTYTEVNTFAAGNGYDTDGHELLLTEAGHAILMIYDPQPIDMSQVVAGGDPNAIVIGLIHYRTLLKKRTKM